MEIAKARLDASDLGSARNRMGARRLITAAGLYLHWVNFAQPGPCGATKPVVATYSHPPHPSVKCGRTSATNPVRFCFPHCFVLGPSLLVEVILHCRVFGFIGGLLMLGAVWLTGWLFDRSAPLIALSLLALNASVVRWADSLRAYGLASVLMLWRWRWLAFRPRARSRNGGSSLALSGGDQRAVPVSKFILFLAVCAAAAAVRIRRHDFKNALTAMAIGYPGGE